MTVAEYPKNVVRGGLVTSGADQRSGLPALVIGGKHHGRVYLLSVADPEISLAWAQPQPITSEMLTIGPMVGVFRYRRFRTSPFLVYVPVEMIASHANISLTRFMENRVRAWMESQI